MKTPQELWAEYVQDGQVAVPAVWHSNIRRVFLDGVEIGRRTMVEDWREVMDEEMRKFAEGFAYQPPVIEKATISDGTGVYPLNMQGIECE